MTSNPFFSRTKPPTTNKLFLSSFLSNKCSGRVPQISPDWTVGVEFDNAIGEGDGSLNGRRYFIAKDCFAKFLPLDQVSLVDQHVGRPEPGTMISVMSAAVRPGQMISIQRVSTVHVQHCFLNAPHHRPGADILAVNTRLHCQCPSCGPCAHVIKPPRTQRLSHNPKNATHMCQFSTYTCCGMESQEEALCTYTGNKITASLPPPISSPSTGLPPIGNSWIEGSGYLASLQAQQSKLVPEEYKQGAAPEDIDNPEIRRRLHRSSSSRRSDSRRKHRGSSRHQERTSSDYSVACSKSEVLYSEKRKTLLNVIDDSSNGQVEFPSDSFWDSETFTQAQLDGEQELGQLVQGNLDATDEISCSSSGRTLETNSADSNDVLLSNRFRIVHKNSMEDRYLFPNEEPIDSTLEDDIENLSQARYGPTIAINRHRANASKNIFRSLRSLVSCLNAPRLSHLHSARRSSRFSPASMYVEDVERSVEQSESISSFVGSEVSAGNACYADTMVEHPVLKEDPEMLKVEDVLVGRSS